MLTTPDILILEDDRGIAQLLKAHLATKFRTYHCYRISQAKLLLKEKAIDLICLDVILPDGNGLNLCSFISEFSPDTRIIALTKKSEMQDRLSCFKAGVDDYLPKPFFPEELVIRIEKLLGISKYKKEGIRYKTLTLEPSSNKLMYKNYAIMLSNTEYLIMNALMQNPGIKSARYIANFISTKRDKPISIKSLIVSIVRLRRKMELNIGMRLIKTRHSKGYHIGF